MGKGLKGKKKTWGRHASCYEMSESRRIVELKDMKKGILPFMPLSSRLGHIRTSALQVLHIAIETHNHGISSSSRVHPPGNASCIPPHKPSPYAPIMHHSPCLPDIQIHFLQAVLHAINSPLTRPAHWVTTSALPYIDPLSNHVILHSLHMAEPSENTFINLFVQTLSLCTTALSMHSGLYPFSW